MSERYIKLSEKELSTFDKSYPILNKIVNVFLFMLYISPSIVFPILCLLCWLSLLPYFALLCSLIPVFFSCVIGYKVDENLGWVCFFNFHTMTPGMLLSMYALYGAITCGSTIAGLIVGTVAAIILMGLVLFGYFISKLVIPTIEENRSFIKLEFFLMRILLNKKPEFKS